MALARTDLACTLLKARGAAESYRSDYFEPLNFAMTMTDTVKKLGPLVGKCDTTPIVNGIREVRKVARNVRAGLGMVTC